MPRQIDKQLVQERFGNRLNSYNQHAVVQQTMARELAEIICLFKPEHSFHTILEVGSGAGALMTELLSRCRVTRYYANDLVEESAQWLLNILQDFPVQEFHFLAGDIEQLATLPTELDLIVSNATLQWLEELDVFFNNMATCLKPGGMLAFSTFSTSNMREIRELEGVGLHYHTIRELEELSAPWFDKLLCREETVQMEFSTPEAVLNHIRKTGVNGLSRHPWSKRRYHHFITRYRQLFSSGQGVHLTYHPVYCCLKKREL